MQEQQWESQVWQRVRQPMAREAGNLRPLRRESMILAGIYRHLANSLRGNVREQAATLYRQELENGAILRGLERLSGGDSGPMQPVPPPEEGTARLLDQCFRSTCRVQTEYLARSAEPETGIVFRVLADNAATQCTAIARLLGSLG